MENAALIASKELNYPSRTADLFEKTSNLFSIHGSMDRAAETLEKAGR